MVTGIRAHCCDMTGNLHTQGFRGAGRRRITALGLQNIGAVNARRRDFYQDFTGAGLGPKDIREFQPVVRSRILQSDGSHLRTCQ